MGQVSLSSGLYNMKKYCNYNKTSLQVGGGSTHSSSSITGLILLVTVPL